MSFETDFDRAFTILLGKAQNTITQTDPSTTTAPPTTGGTIANGTAYDIVFPFGGGGNTLSSSTSDPLLVEVPDSGTVVWYRVYAGNATGTPVNITATLEVRQSDFGTFGTYTTIASPTLSSASHSTVDGSAHVNAGDILLGRLVSIAGAATWLSMFVRVRRDVSTS